MKRALLQILISGFIAFYGTTLLAQGGTGYVVERIEVRGNQKTKASVILRSLALKQGDRLTPGLLDASRKALYRTRLFRTVHVASKPGSEKGKAVVVVYVDEKRFGDLGVSLEYTELDGFGVAADAYDVNLGGEGKVVGAEFNQGERIKSLGFLYSDPWLSGSNLSLHVRVSTASYDRDLYRSSNPAVRGGYDLDRTGGALGIGRPVGSSYRLIFQYSYEDVDVDNFFAPTISTGGGLYAREVAASLGRAPVSYLGLDLRRVPSGQPWGAVPGFDFSLQANFSATYLGSTGDYLRVRTEIYRHFRGFLDGETFSVGMRAGGILGAPPFYERFYLDGPNQLRGFERRAIGPEGGTRFLTTEGIYMVPIPHLGRFYFFGEWAIVSRSVDHSWRSDHNGTLGIGMLLFNRVDISFGFNARTLIVKSHRFGGINVGL